MVTDPEVTAGHCVDWSGRYRGATPALVRPGTAGEVAEVVAHCRRAGIALCLQGGNTGLVGGSVPLDGEVLVSLRRLDLLGPVEEPAGQLTAGAGVSLGQVRRAAAAAGWAYGVDLASRESASVGGMVATNAGGVHVLRHGSTRAQVVGIEAVLGTGALVSHLGGLVKDNTGYDLAALLCGSEGTLGVVTAARLRLVPAAPEVVVALLGFTTTTAAVIACADLRRGLAELQAAELMLDGGVDLVCGVYGIALPLERRSPAYLVVEAAGVRDPVPLLGAAIDALDGVESVAVATEPGAAAALWRLREGHTTAIATVGVAHKLDVAVPLGSLAQFVDEVGPAVAAADPEARVWLFGHAADGSVHVNVTGPAPDDLATDEAVVALVSAMAGSISAEHGVGTAKRRWLHLARSQAEIAAFRAIKSALDPDGICNPAVLVPLA